MGRTARMWLVPFALDSLYPSPSRQSDALQSQTTQQRLQSRFKSSQSLTTIAPINQTRDAGSKISLPLPTGTPLHLMTWNVVLMSTRCAGGKASFMVPPWACATVKKTSECQLRHACRVEIIFKAYPLLSGAVPIVWLLLVAWQLAAHVLLASSGSCKKLVTSCKHKPAKSWMLQCHC